MLQVRIVTVDHYICPPIEGLDITYSEFRKSSIKQVPVIRIFGTTPTGEKTCVHVHGVFPYICIPYDGSEPHMKLSYQLAVSLDKAINIASGYSNSNTQHVYKVVLVSGIPFYGYHQSKHQYLKVYFYKPSVVKQAVSLLQNGAIMNKIYQPHEAHIPFILQFFIDFNLYGMSFIDLENVKFRKTNYPELLSNLSADSFLPETIPAVSCSQYEVDVAAADILNRPSSQGNGEINNPGIAAIWEDEKRRRALTQGTPLAIPQLHSQRPPLKPTTSELFYLRRLEAILNNASQSSDDNTGESVSNKSYAIEEPLHNPALDASFVSLHAIEAFPHQNLVDTIVDEDLAIRNSPMSQHSLNRSLALDNEDFELLDVLEFLADTRPAIVDDDSVLGSQTIRAKTSEESSDDSGDDEKWHDKTLVVEEDDALRLFDLSMPEIDENLILNNVTHEPQPGPSRLQLTERESLIPQVDGISDICNKSPHRRRKKKIPQVDGLNDLKKKPGRKSLGIRGGVSHGLKASNSSDRYSPGGGLIFPQRKSNAGQSSAAQPSDFQSSDAQSEMREPSQCPLTIDSIITTLGDKLFTEYAGETSDNPISSGSGGLISVSEMPDQSETNDTRFMFPTLDNLLSQNELPTITNTPPCLESESCNEANEIDQLLLTQSTIQNTVGQEDLVSFLPMSEEVLVPPLEASEERGPYFAIDVPVVETSANLQPAAVGLISTDCEDCGGDCGKEGHCADAFICTLMNKKGESILRGDPSMYSPHTLENEDSLTELFSGGRKENSSSMKEVGSTTIDERAIKCKVPVRKSSRLNKSQIEAVNISPQDTDITKDSSPVGLSVELDNSASIFNPNSDDDNDNEPTGIPGFTNTMYDDISKSLASPWSSSNNDASCSDSEMNRLSGALKNGQMEEILQTGSGECMSQPSTSRREELIAFLEMQKANEQRAEMDPVTDELLRRGRKPIAGPPRLGKNLALAKIFCSTPLPTTSKVNSKQLRRLKREQRTRKLSLSAQKRNKEKPTLQSVRSSQQKGSSQLFSSLHKNPSIKPCTVCLVKLTDTNIENIAQELKVKVLNKSLLSKTTEELTQNTVLKSGKVMASRTRASVQNVSKSLILCSGRSRRSNSRKSALKPVCNTTSAKEKDAPTLAHHESQESVESTTLSSVHTPTLSCTTRSPRKGQTVSTNPSELSEKSLESVMSVPPKLHRRPRSKNNVYSEIVIRVKPVDPDGNQEGCLVNEAIQEQNDESNEVLEQPSRSCIEATPTSITPPQNAGRSIHLPRTKKVITNPNLFYSLDSHRALKLRTASNDVESEECGEDSSSQNHHHAVYLEKKHESSVNALSERNKLTDDVKTSSYIPKLNDTCGVRDIPQINQESKSSSAESSHIAMKGEVPKIVSKVKLKTANIKVDHKWHNKKGTSTSSKKKTSEKCNAFQTDSSSQLGCVDEGSPPQNLQRERNCEVLGTEKKVECEKDSHIFRSRMGSNSSDTPHMISLPVAVVHKHKTEQLPKSLKYFKIPKCDNQKPDNAYSTQACSPLTKVIKDVNTDENPKSYPNSEELIAQKTEANKPNLLLKERMDQVEEGTSSNNSVISMDLDFTLSPNVVESDEIVNSDADSPKNVHWDSKRKSSEALYEDSATKRRHDIAVTSNNQYIPHDVGPCKVETPKSVAHWFAQPFAPWSFWSPCTSPRAHHHAHLFSPPRPGSPKDKSSQLDLPSVGRQGCMLTEGDVMREQSTTVIKSLPSISSSLGDMFLCSPSEVDHQDRTSPVVLKVQDSSQDQSILDMFSEESGEQEDMNSTPHGSKGTSERSECIDSQLGDLRSHTLSLAERENEIDEATSNTLCDEFVQGRSSLKPPLKHSFFFTLLLKPPSNKEVIDSLSSLNIPQVINEKPFYSNFLDVKGKMEVGGNVLDLTSKSFCHLEEFQSSIPGLAGLLDQQKQVFESLWGSQVKNCFNHYIMNHSAMRGVSIVPVKRPPPVHDVIIWSKARQILQNKVNCKSTSMNTNRISKRDAFPISESLMSTAVLKQLKPEKLCTNFGAQASTPLHPKVFHNNEIRSPHLTPIMLTSAESQQSSTNSGENVKRLRKKVIPLSSSQGSEIEADGDLGVRPLETQSIPLHFGINDSHDNSAVKQLLANSQFCRDVASPLYRNEVNASACQVKGVNSSPGFKLVLENLQTAKTSKEYQFITTMIMEIHICTCGTMNPDPERDSIRAVFYMISNDVPNNHKIPSEITGIIAVDDAISTSPLLGRCAIDGLVEYASDERALLGLLVQTVRKWDPDIVCGFEIEMLSWGYVLQRSSVLGMNLIKDLSRIQNQKEGKLSDDFDDNNGLSGLKITGRIALDVWRLFRSEVALQSYTFENLVYHILHQRVSRHSFATLSRWWENPTHLHRWMTVRYYQLRVHGVLKLLDQLDIIGRTSELARLFGIQLFEVLSRGSQFRVESMMLRLAKPMNYIPVSPSIQQRAHMRAPECLPLIMEPESRYYKDPLIVLDFQSLYPSMIIAYNYCFSTCLGRIEHLGKSSHFEFGCTELRVKNSHLQRLKDNISVSPSGVAFVSKSVRQGILPRMLEEILEARLAVKQSMKHHKNDHTLQRVLHARQLGLKLIANVTYGYTSANFSGRMPCIEIGDSIVSKGRETLERAISLVQGNSDWRARVVYGDTDSLFVLVPGRSRQEAFRIGEEIAAAVTQDNPTPVKLKLEKVYQPSILQTKKRYVGFMYESPDQSEPIYEAKGIETVRRDGCPAVAKILEKSLRILFESSDVSTVKNYVTHQFSKILSGRANIQDLIFAKEYRGKENYRQGACVPALELTKRWLRHDRRAEPRIGERVPYVIVNGPPGSALINLVRHPNELLTDTSLRYNGVYYVTRAIIPPLARCLSLLGADVSSWYGNISRRNQVIVPTAQTSFKKTISQYFTTMECACCGDLTNSGVCEKCRANPQLLVTSLTSKIHQWETTHLSITKICQSCLGRSQPLDCCSLDCPIIYRRHQSSQNKEHSVFVSRLLGDFLN
ncbi:DNA polymerase zeta catalytic subunit [Frankliniella fusca]|uniref:DNA polymerase zeta catalytic subunit n=1 Tax=Frankliniella fusca TaxID=407009 RepID=A0AAE1LTB2_9NEOP|nr:DNA polymerase zeta catalytic subunit [Frankliniella fusca]